VVDRPADLPQQVEWCTDLRSVGSVPRGLLLANEWLDNIPVDVVQDGRLVEVDETGRERAGAPPGERDLGWQQRWGADAERLEIGWPRDQAWAQAVACLDVGAAVAIDYRLIPEVHRAGTLTGYRDGRQVAPVPDGSCDLTSHVLLESCAEAAGGPAVLLDQRTALSALGVTAALPPRELASSDPSAYLDALTRAGSVGELTARDGLGSFGWLLQPRGVPLPEALQDAARPLGWA
jgi:SAM-dependent MidA family methyltransferase